jgi:hypothetical protein
MYPEMVESGEAIGGTGQVIPDFMTVSYERLVTVLLEAVKELDTRVTALENS